MFTLSTLLNSGCGNECYKKRFAEHINKNIYWVLKIAHPSCTFNESSIEDDYKTFNITYLDDINTTKKMVLNFETDYNYNKITQIYVVEDNADTEAFAVLNGITDILTLIPLSGLTGTSLTVPDITAKEITINILNRQWRDYRANIHCKTTF